VLLGTVVDVAFDPPAFGVGCGHDAASRGLQGLGLPPDLVERGLERGVQSNVVEGQTDLPGQVTQKAFVLRGERLRLLVPFDDQKAEQLTGVSDGSHSHRRLGPLRQDAGQPDLGPGGAGNAGSCHGGLFGPSERDGRNRTVRVGDGPFKAATGLHPYLGRR
jgi:hypothetical protein